MAKRAVNVRIEESVLTRFDAWCLERGESRTAVLESFMARQPDAPRAVAVPPSVSAAPGEVRQPSAVVGSKGCDHPKGSQRVLGYGTICDQCHTLVKR